MSEQPSHHDIYERVGNFGGRMSALENLVSEGFREIKEAMTDGFDGIRSVTGDHEKRLRDVEITQGAAKGGLKTLLWVGTVIGGVMGLVFTAIGWVLG